MKKETILKIVEIIAIIGLLGASYFRNIQSVEFHKDESHWIATSYMFEAYFRGEFWSDAWRDSQPTVTNPPVPRYIIGIGRFIGGYRIPDLNRRWDYEHNRNFNVRKGAMPSDGLLWWSRLPMAILAVLSILIGFFLIKEIAGRIAAYIWVTLGAVSSFFLLQTRRAMAESPILFFVMLATFFCYRALKNLQQEANGVRWKAYLYMGLSGLCLGLAGESKMNGLSVVAGVILSIAIVLWKERETVGRKIRRILSLSALITIVTVIVFWGIYPYLWPDLAGRTIKIFTNRVEEMRYQNINDAPDAINTMEQRLTIFPMRIFEYYAVFDFKGALALNLILTTVGIVIVAKKARDWWLKGRNGNLAAIVLLASAVTASAPTFFTMLDWDRYYLFPVFFSTIFIAVALGWIGRKLFDWLAPKFSRRFTA